MRLGFDIDDVVLDLAGCLDLYVQSNFGVEWPIGALPTFEFNNVTFHHDEEFDVKIKEDLIEKAKEGYFAKRCQVDKEARYAIQKLKFKGGHKIFFISSRPKHLQPITFKWLRHNKLPFDELRVIGYKDEKGFHGRQLNLDMYVDDLEIHLESMYRYKKRWRKGLILLDKPWNNDYIDGSRFRRVKSWKELLRHVGVQNR